MFPTARKVFDAGRAPGLGDRMAARRAIAERQPAGSR